MRRFWFACTHSIAAWRAAWDCYGEFAAAERDYAVMRRVVELSRDEWVRMAGADETETERVWN